MRYARPHNYRWRQGLVEGEAKYKDLEKRLAKSPVITVPTITMEGDANGAPHPEPAAYTKNVLGQIFAPNHQGPHGHNLPQEAPQAPALPVAGCSLTAQAGSASYCTCALRRVPSLAKAIS